MGQKRNLALFAPAALAFGLGVSAAGGAFADDAPGLANGLDGPIATNRDAMRERLLAAADTGAAPLSTSAPPPVIVLEAPPAVSPPAPAPASELPAKPLDISVSTAVDVVSRALPSGNLTRIEPRADIKVAAELPHGISFRGDATLTRTSRMREAYADRGMTGNSYYVLDVEPRYHWALPIADSVKPDIGTALHLREAAFSKTFNMFGPTRIDAGVFAPASRMTPTAYLPGGNEIYENLPDMGLLTPKTFGIGLARRLFGSHHFDLSARAMTGWNLPRDTGSLDFAVWGPMKQVHTERDDNDPTYKALARRPQHLLLGLYTYGAELYGSYNPNDRWQVTAYGGRRNGNGITNDKPFYVTYGGATVTNRGHIRPLHIDYSVSAGASYGDYWADWFNLRYKPQSTTYAVSSELKRGPYALTASYASTNMTGTDVTDMNGRTSILRLEAARNFGNGMRIEAHVADRRVDGEKMASSEIDPGTTLVRRQPAARSIGAGIHWRF